MYLSFFRALLVRI